MTTYLLISNVLLWLSVIALLFVVFALTRQVGVLYERIAPAGALMVSQSLSVSDKAPELVVMDTNTGADIAFGGADDTKRSQLLFFLSPECPVCKTLIPVLKSVRRAEGRWLDIVLATDFDKSALAQFVDAHELNDFALANSQTLGKTYGVAKLPYGVLIDESGVIKSMGLVNSREHFESLFLAKETNTASIQDYLERKQASLK